MLHSSPRGDMGNGVHDRHGRHTNPPLLLENVGGILITRWHKSSSKLDWVTVELTGEKKKTRVSAGVLMWMFHVLCKHSRWISFPTFTGVSFFFLFSRSRLRRKHGGFDVRFTCQARSWLKAFGNKYRETLIDTDRRGKGRRERERQADRTGPAAVLVPRRTAPRTGRGAQLSAPASRRHYRH